MMHKWLSGSKELTVQGSREGGVLASGAWIKRATRPGSGNSVGSQLELELHLAFS